MDESLAAAIVDGFESGMIPDPRKWLMLGGGGHEDGQAGLSASTFTGEGLVDMLEAYRDCILERARAINRSNLEASADSVDVVFHGEKKV